MTPTIGLEPDEVQLVGMPVMVAVYSQANNQAPGLPFFVWGDANVVATSALVAYAWHQSQQRKVAALNRPQWRIVDYGTLHITNQRVAIQGSLAWQDIPFSEIRMFEQHEDGVVLHMAQRAPGKMIVEGPGYLAVLLNFLVFGRVVVPLEPPPPVLPPSGWHPDPAGRHQHRFWDGAQWTEHVANDGAVTSDPLS